MGLERQEKQIRIVMEELKTIQANHESAIVQYKKRLQLKDDAAKVVSAVLERKTNSVTGDKMVKLIQAMENDSLFKNKISVGKATKLRNELID